VVEKNKVSEKGGLETPLVHPLCGGKEQDSKKEE